MRGSQPHLELRSPFGRPVAHRFVVGVPYCVGELRDRAGCCCSRLCIRHEVYLTCSKVLLMNTTVFLAFLTSVVAGPIPKIVL